MTTRRPRHPLSARLLSALLTLGIAWPPSASAASEPPRRETLRPMMENKVEAGLEEAFRADGEDLLRGHLPAMLETVTGFLEAQQVEDVQQTVVRALTTPEGVLGPGHFRHCALYLVRAGRDGKGFEILNRVRTLEGSSRFANWSPVSEGEAAEALRSPSGLLWIKNRRDAAANPFVDGELLQADAERYGGRLSGKRPRSALPALGRAGDLDHGQ